MTESNPERKRKRDSKQRSKSNQSEKPRQTSPGSSRSRTLANDHDEIFQSMLVLLEKNNELMNKCMEAMTRSGDSGIARGAMEQIMAAKIIRRPVCVKVDIKCNYLRIISIDTIKQEFEAEMYILSKWTDPAFYDISGSSCDIFDERQHWRPHLVIKNCDTSLNKETVTFRVHKNVSGYDHPVVFMGWKFQAVMKECLELEHYPVDVQDLTIQLTSDLTIDECELIEDKQDLSTVNVKSFSDAQEWCIFHHVDFTSTYNVREYENVTKHPLLSIQCRVSRNLWYFLWNVIFIMFVIVCLTFSCYAIHPSSSDRLAVNITLMLTGVTFKLVVTQSLPRISYLTSLDIYVLAALVFLGLHAMQNSILIHISTTMSPMRLKMIDRISILVLFSSLIVFHIIFGLKVFFYIMLKELGKVRSSALMEADNSKQSIL